jgi:hypothetical protein
MNSGYPSRTVGVGVARVSVLRGGLRNPSVKVGPGNPWHVDEWSSVFVARRSETPRYGDGGSGDDRGVAAVWAGGGVVEVGVAAGGVAVGEGVWGA